MSYHEKRLRIKEELEDFRREAHKAAWYQLISAISKVAEVLKKGDELNDQQKL